MVSYSEMKKMINLIRRYVYLMAMEINDFDTNDMVVIPYDELLYNSRVIIRQYED